MDDEYLILDALSILFAQHFPDVEVVTAESFDEAMTALAEKGPFSAVVTDLMLEGDGDGVRLLEQIRQGEVSTSIGTPSAVLVGCYSCDSPPLELSFDFFVRKSEVVFDMKEIALLLSLTQFKRDS